jgi:tetratricopeptide (TPR) repeat protein
MSAIWASRFGLTETELLEITKLTRYALSEFLIALEFHLMRRSGLYTFFHNYLRQAVEFRYLYTEDEKKFAHTKLAEYFSTREYSTRRRDEEPWQWQQAGELPSLEQCLRDPQMAAMFESDREVYEAFSYWKSIGEISFDEEYIERLKEAEVSDEIKFSAYKNIISLFIIAGKYERGGQFLEAGKEIQSYLPQFDERVLKVKEADGMIDCHLGRFEQTISKTKTIYDSLDKAWKEKELSFQLLDLIATAYYSLGKFEEAVSTTEEALMSSIKVFGSQSYQVAMKYKNLGALLMMQGKLNDAETICSQAWQLYSNLFGENHPETADCLMNFSTCLMNQKKYADAEEKYLQAQNIFLKTVGVSHPLALRCGINIAYLNSETGNYRKAREMSFEQFSQCEKVFGVNSLNSLIVATFIGYTYYLEKNYIKAKEYYDEYLPLRIKVSGEDHPDVIRFKARLKEINEALKESSSQP